MSLFFRTPSARVVRLARTRQYATGTQEIESSLGTSIRTALYATGFVVGATAFAVYYADSRSAIHRYVIPPLSRTLFDGETAHKFALRALSSGLSPRDQGTDDERLRVELWEDVLANPVGLAAGFDKDGEAIDGLFNLGFGWVEIGSVTPKPQPGNPTPRVFHLAEDRAVINRYGFPSKGSTAVLTRLQARHQSHDSTVEHNQSLRPAKYLSINLGKNKTSAPDSLSDFLLGVRTFGPLADVLVVNVSSPNTPGLRSLQSRGMLIELLGAVKRERDGLHLNRRLPKLLVKIAPDLSNEEISDVAEAVRETGIDGVIVSNTTIQRPNTLKSRNKGETGGLSGPPLKSLTLNALKTLRPLLPASVPIIGCGGITTGADAVEFAKAGASTIQLYTSFAYEGVGTPRRVKDEITQILRDSNQTWMDLVKEGQKLAWSPKGHKNDAPSLDVEIESALQGGASKFAAMGEQLISILKAEGKEASDKV
ncbi:hypothetical protein M408DRAFT_14299 [Serendipita vermifera MAFF 305830]|uniref:Dihydroorotate dehydrogenase (quinone), mitochondrial n=1 Tax=Serendipita vermifera MAFF 305830 TaxID=933852 RepID=A0A0C2X6H1_SERVB|nr:hypothetical protein M408DRAFT_14299 [Serendipita vermifera MAFF 305830]